MSFVKTAQRKAGKTLDFTITKQFVTKDAAADCIIEGYANTSSKDRVGDVVLPEAFASTLATYMTNPVMLENHDWDKPAGCILESKIDDKGLWVRAKVSAARPDLQVMVREGTLRTFSIGYNEVLADFDDATKTKIIKELELLEISIVTVPANAEALFGVAGTPAAPQPTSGEADAPAADDAGKSAKKPKSAKALKDFIADVKFAADRELTGTEVVACCDYFMTNEDHMTIKELIAELRKAAPAAATKTGDAPSAGAPAPAAAAGNASAGVTAPAGGAGASAEGQVAAMLQALSAKVDALANAMAQVLEGMKQEDEAAPADGDKPAEGDKKPADDKPADGASADDEKAKKPAADKKPDPKDPKDDEDASDEDMEKALAEIEAIEAEMQAHGGDQE